MSLISRGEEEARHPWNDEEAPFRVMLVVFALSTIATTAGVLLATVVHG
ncbi:MAG: hypothetical protein ABL901_10900 [Hyphomicrobiaceae bacterium]